MGLYNKPWLHRESLSGKKKKVRKGRGAGRGRWREEGEEGEER